MNTKVPQVKNQFCGRSQLTEIVVEGTLKSDGTQVLDQKPNFSRSGNGPQAAAGGAAGG